MNPRHSILVVTYKQQELIGACLDSILSQSVTPHEIVIIDDCSPDGTWDVVRKYAEKYPSLIKAKRNEVNVGVFENVNTIATMATGDLVNFIAGDDLLPQGILSKYNDFIAANGLHFSDPFIIYTNAEILLPNGNVVKKDNFSNRHFSTAELTLLCALYVWDTGISIELLKNIPPIRRDVGYQADWLQHLQRVSYARGNEYFLDAVGYIYRQGVGVTAATAVKKQIDSKVAVMNIFANEYSEHMSQKVRRFFDFEISYFSYFLAPSPGKYVAMVLRRVLAGRLPKNSTYHRNLKLFVPIELKRFVKRALQ